MLALLRQPMRRTNSLIAVSVLLLFAGAARPATADFRAVFDEKSSTVDQSGSTLRETDRTTTVTTGDWGCRLETARQIWILDHQAEQFLMLDKRKETYFRLSLPVRLEQFMSEADIASFNAIHAQIAATVAKDETGKPQTFKNWPATPRHFTFKQGGARRTVKVDLMLSTEVPFDWQCMKSLLQYGNELHLEDREWVHLYLAPEGAPVSKTIEIKSYGVTQTLTSELSSVSETKANPANLRVPEAYEEKKFEFVLQRGNTPP